MRILIYLKAVPYIQDVYNRNIVAELTHTKWGIMWCAAQSWDKGVCLGMPALAFGENVIKSLLSLLYWYYYSSLRIISQALNTN
jgi:hypothetical protein